MINKAEAFFMTLASTVVTIIWLLLPLIIEFKVSKLELFYSSFVATILLCVLWIMTLASWIDDSHG